MSAVMQHRPVRIPTSLQAVFIASSRGKEVNDPPPSGTASKVFFRNWRFQQKPPSAEVLESRKRSTSDSSARSEKAVSVHVSSQEPKGVRRSLSSELAPLCSVSPQSYLDPLIRSRGYSTARFKSLQTAYYNKPTELQQASYDMHLISLVRQQDIEEFQNILDAGISPNPCNSYGESLVHLVCRRGQVRFLRAMVNAGCCLQVTDDYGRTPLHDACWASKPCFDVVQMILKVDARMLFLQDCRGATPLSYVPKKDWHAWLQFLESVKDDFWPQRDVSKQGEQGLPDLVQSPPHSRPVPDPANALSVELAAMLVSQRITPEESVLLAKEGCSTSDELLLSFTSDDASDEREGYGAEGEIGDEDKSDDDGEDEDEFEDDDEDDEDDEDEDDDCSSICTNDIESILERLSHLQ